MKRRLFLGGLAATIAAPAIVARESIMSIKPLRPDAPDWSLMGWDFGTDEGTSWLVMHPDYAAHLREIVDGSRNEVGDLEIGRLDRFTFYESPGIEDPGPIVASNYGRGPGLLTEDGAGVRRWSPLDPPVPTAREIQAKRAEAWRKMRQWLEPNRSRRWV